MTSLATAYLLPDDASRVDAGADVPASRADMPAIAASIPAFTLARQVRGASDTVSSVRAAAGGSRSMVSSVDGAVVSGAAVTAGAEPRDADASAPSSATVSAATCNAAAAIPSIG